jgi:hypothetical protein
MFRFRLRAALVALTAIAAFALPASALATNVTRWQIMQPADPTGTSVYAPYADVATVLSDPYRGAYAQDLVYGNETFGVNLTWTTPPSGGPTLGDYQWEFIRQPGHYVTQQIAASDQVALYNRVNSHYLVLTCGGGFEVACLGLPAGSVFGINLGWSTTPSYQWQVAKGGDSSFPYVADLYNDTEQAYLIDYNQTFGVDLGWIHAPFETGPDYIPPSSTGQVQVPPVTSPSPPLAP